MLFTSLGGGSFERTSPFMLAMIGLAVVAGLVFIWAGRRAVEPVLPLYLQTVKGVSPTVSGLQLISMMFGTLDGRSVRGRLWGARGITGVCR